MQIFLYFFYWKNIKYTKYSYKLVKNHTKISKIYWKKIKWIDFYKKVIKYQIKIRKLSENHKNTVQNCENL